MILAQVFICGADEIIQVWKLEEDGPTLEQELSGHEERVLCLAITKDGRLVSGCEGGTLRYWSLSDGRCLQVMDCQTVVDTELRTSVTCVLALPDRVIAASSHFRSNQIKVWACDQRKIEKLFAEGVGRQRAICDVAKVITKFL